MFKSNAASKLLNGNYYITAKPLYYIEHSSKDGFSLYVPPGYVIKAPILPRCLSILLPKRFLHKAIMYRYLRETQSIFYNKKSITISDRCCDILFIDMLIQAGLNRVIVSLISVLLPCYRRRYRIEPDELLRKNAVEFYLQEKAKLDGYWS